MFIYTFWKKLRFVFGAKKRKQTSGQYMTRLFCKIIKEM